MALLRNLLASAARTASGTSSPLDLLHTDVSSVAALVAVTAASGTTPSLTVSLEWSNDGTNWFTADPADEFTALTATANKVKDFTVKGRYLRSAHTISGTDPSFTFSVDLRLS